MKPFQELTRLGRLRRMRQLARVALAGYGIRGARFALARQAGNTLFRVHAPNLLLPEAGELFEADQYLLRVHQPGYQTPEALELELAWLAAMRREANLPVPEPVPAPDGRLLILAATPGVPGPRHCSLLRWIRGRSLKHAAQFQHYRAQGRLMARLHNFAAQWLPPPGLSKRQFDWNGLFRDDVGSGMPNAEAWALLPAWCREPFEVVARRVRQVMDAWGQGPQVYGLIHGDLGVDANLLFCHGEPRAIDFDDSGYGYWVFDLAVGLEHCWQAASFPRYRDALLDGYAEYRSLPEQQLAQMELFIAATEVYWNLWATGGTHLYPHLLAEYGARIRRTAELVVRYVQQE